MNTRKLISYTLLVSLATGCAAGPRYKPAPSAKIEKVYQREQISSIKAKQVKGAVISGILGGLLGPVGAIITGIGTGHSNKKAHEAYWKSFSNTRLVGVVVEDVSDKRIKQYMNNRSWFSNLPDRKDIPKHYSVDFGSGNLLMFPIAQNVSPNIGDVVSVYSPPNAWTLVNKYADFNALPVITNVLCDAGDQACIDKPNNEPGIAERLGEPSEE